MSDPHEPGKHQVSIEEMRLDLEARHLQLEEKRLLHDKSFAKKWLPHYVTLMVGVIAAMVTWVQVKSEVETTKRAHYETTAQNERLWGIKVVEMYFSQHELFDLNNSPEQASQRLRLLAAVAPTAVKGILSAELDTLPPPAQSDRRLLSLAAVASVQRTLQGPAPKASDYTIYVQYPTGAQELALKAKSLLITQEYNVPDIDEVANAPTSLQVRYYRLDQQTLAEELVKELGKKLGLTVSSRNAVLLRSSKELPSGILEVWLPSSSH